ncbi:MAG: PD-(D/E)XK nuclease-like domain-containing protein [Magnetococcales bacterium]|nr:PD-(D/E)XK nuclease-like domain-containing protein [Magnetococcales bacterium]
MKLPYGIYLNLPLKDYLADPGLSATGIKQLWSSPLTYWANSSMNPDREQRKETQAKMFGTAFHKLVLEGFGAFLDCYASLPDKEDYPDALDGVSELREECDRLGLKKSGTMLDMCQRIREVDPDVELWPEIVDEFNRDNLDKMIMNPEDMAMIRRMASMIDAHPSARNVFTGGGSEVSIFWQEEEYGLRMKARLDYLRPNMIIDLKTFSNPLGLPLDTAITRAIATNKYHVQAVVYLKAFAAARDFIARGLMPKANGEQWFLPMVQCSEPRFFFVFVETGAANNVVLRELRREISGAESIAYQAGCKIFRHGIEIFNRCEVQYGIKPWLDPRPAESIQDHDFPLWAQE